MFEVAGRHSVKIENFIISLEHVERKTASSAGAGVVVHNSADISVSNNLFVGGQAGIYLADSSDLANDLAGTSLCAAGHASNRRVHLVGNVFEHVAGIADIQVANLRGGVIARNHGNHGGAPGPNDVIKVHCGPVNDVSFRENYLHHSSHDGLDLISFPEVAGRDGPIVDNEFVSNIVYANNLNGLSFKGNAPGVNCPWLGATQNAQVGGISVHHNLLFSNGASGISLQDSSPPGTSCASAAPKSKRSHLWRNAIVQTRDVERPAYRAWCGVVLHRAFNVLIRDSWLAPDLECGVYLSGGFISAPGYNDRFISLEGNFASSDGVHVNSALKPPTIADQRETEGGVIPFIAEHIFTAQSYHCRDDDQDGCPNGCEALLGRDPVMAEVGPCRSGDGVFDCGPAGPLCPQRAETAQEN